MNALNQQDQCGVQSNLKHIPKICLDLYKCIGTGSVVGIATGYVLDDPGSNPGGGEFFRTCPDRPWDPTNLLYNSYGVFSGGKERPGRDADPSFLLVPWT